MRYGVSDDDLVQILTGHASRPFGYDPFQRRLVPAAPGHGNTVFLRDEATVQDRVSSARRYRLINGTI